MVTTTNNDGKKGALNNNKNNITDTSAKGDSSNLTSAVSPASFYGTSSKNPPALPKRQNQYTDVGSSHTTYLSPDVPSTNEPVSPVPNYPAQEDEEMSDSLNEQPDNNWYGLQYYNTPWPSDQQEFHPRLAPATEWGTETQMIEDTYNSDPPIDGRNEIAERRWWEKQSATFLGRGLLPPLLVEELHNGEHSLISVSISPNIGILASSTSASSATKLPSSPKSPDKQSQGSHSRSSSSSSTHVPPTAEELREAIPHPNAYYCRKHNGWVILAWRSSTVLPPLVESVSQTDYPMLPNQDRRKKVHNCLDFSHPFEIPNLTHHFHAYKKAVDASMMTPAYTPRSWEVAELLKKARRRMTIGSQELDPDTVARAVEGDTESKKETQMTTDKKEEKESHNLLDLYLCCQCCLCVYVSDVIPGVVPVKTVDALISEKEANPSVNTSKHQSVTNALETIIMIIENKLWKGNNKSIPVSGRLFSAKVGWNLTVQRFFESIGFKYCAKDDSHEAAIQPPDTNPSSEEGRMNRDRLLRAWVEISAITADYYKRYSGSLKDTGPHKLWVTIENARENYQMALGAHPDQIKRGRLPPILVGNEYLNAQWNKLGMTPSTYDSELVHYAYLAQCRCDSTNTQEYFEALSTIVTQLKAVASCPASLEILLSTELSRGRFTQDDFRRATYTLGFGSTNSLRVEYNEADSDFIKNAWRDALRRSWHDSTNSVSARHDINESFRVIAEMRRDPELIKALEEEQRSGMTPDRAYATLEVPFNVDEDMLITIYNMRIEDQPSSLERMQEAMRFIAEYTCSDRLQQFLLTGSDPGTIVPQTRSEWPRGLNQLGNTCYLNSLLQYFYTIKDLREAIAPLSVLDEKFADGDKLKDDDLKNHRVGGRIVSRHEVVRSRKFVSQLANLFHHLENSASPSVTPTLELAKLALVTSKDEEEEDAEPGGTDSSNSTDATLVDEPAPIRESSPPQPKSPTSPGTSVLGKRSRTLTRKKTDNTSEEQGKDKEDYVLISKPSGSNTPVTATVDSEGDISMAENGSSDSKNASASASKAPPLPPRPKTQQSGSDMMFGKQHDVAECMDNCMFQIETALLQFGELAGPDDSSKRSIVKRLFYGKIRQRLSLAPDPTRTKSSLHEREDFFSHLPVNVSEESFDLYDGLSGYFDDVVDYEGTKARMEVSLVELPPILQIQLQRVQFNRDTLQPYKSHAYVKFGESICMDRFLDDAPSEKKNRSKEIQAELTVCRERIAQLTQGKHAPYDQSLNDSYEFLSRQNVLDLPEASESLKNMLIIERDNVLKELEDLRSRISVLKTELESLWVDECRAEYELTSVFVHRGTGPSFGHYFIYQRWLPDNGDEWFKYNDSSVTKVDKSEVLADTTGNTANPYLLVFARKGSQVIQTVNRAETTNEN